MTATPRLIMIPGMLWGRELWQPQLDRLAEVAHCHAVDDHLRHSSIDRIADAIIAKAPDRFSLAGLSMGGYVALEICRRHADRVERLALLDTTMTLDSPMTTQAREKSIELARDGQFETVVRSIVQQALWRPGTAMTEALIDNALRLGPATLARQQRAIMARRDQRETVARLACPTLVICGQYDRIIPPDHSRALAELAANATYHELPDCGHLSTLEQPDKVTQLMIQWLGEPA